MTLWFWCGAVLPRAAGLARSPLSRGGAVFFFSWRVAPFFGGPGGIWAPLRASFSFALFLSLAPRAPTIQFRACVEEVERIFVFLSAEWQFPWLLGRPAFHFLVALYSY